MGVDEDAHQIAYTEDGNKVVFRFADYTFSKDRYPNYEFVVDTKCDGKFKYGSDEVFFEDKKSKGNPIFTISYKKASHIEILHSVTKEAEFTDIAALRTEYNDQFNKNINFFELESKNKEFEIVLVPTLNSVANLLFLA